MESNPKLQIICVQIVILYLLTKLLLEAKSFFTSKLGS